MSTLRLNSEHVLFRGYGIPLVPGAQRCACGGWVTPRESDERAVSIAQQDHNATPRHREWRVRDRP
jgi:hypothetical protein